MKTTNNPNAQVAESLHTKEVLTIQESECSDQKMLNNDCNRNHIDIPEMEAEVWFTIDAEGMGRKVAQANVQRIVKAVNMHDEQANVLTRLNLFITNRDIVLPSALADDLVAVLLKASEK